MNFNDDSHDTLVLAPHHSLYPSTQITLGPHSSSLIQCVSPEFVSPDGLTITTPHSIKYGLEVEATVMTIFDNTIPLLITNLTDSETVLDSDMDIATFEVMDIDQMHPSITHDTINSLSLEVTDEQPSWGRNMTLTEPPLIQKQPEITSDTIGTSSPPESTLPPTLF